MADLEDIKLRENIKRIAGIGDLTSFPVMSGKVLSVDADDNVANVLLTVDADGGEDQAVPASLNVITGNTDGIYLVPAADADCEVAEIDGPGKWSLIRASKYVKVSGKIGNSTFEITNDGIVWNGGNNGGIPMIKPANDNLDTLKNYIKETLEPQIAAALTAVGVGPAANGPGAATSFNTAVSAQVITFEDMENTKIKQ